MSKSKSQMNQKQIHQAVLNSIQSNNWMIRTDNEGVSYHGFQWNPVGEWTEAPDWNPEPIRGFGLHGQSKQASGYGGENNQRVLFCETQGPQIIINGNKIKVRRARILLVNDLSLAEHLNFDETLGLTGCTSLTHLPEHLTVGGYLYLRWCTSLTHLPKHLTIKGNLYLNGCTGLTHLPEHLTVNGDLNLSGCAGLTHLPEYLTVNGDLYLEWCTSLTSLPEHLTVKGNLFLPGNLE